MFKVLFITFSGIGLGYLFRKAAWVTFLERGISYTIWALLFFFGLQVGANEQVVNNLDTLGLQALAISAAGLLGSCIAAWALGKWVFTKGVMNGSAFPDNDLSGHDKGQNAFETQEPSRTTLRQFIGGFTVVAFFVFGCICGWMRLLPHWLSDGEISMYVLYLLMIQVGMSIGSDCRLKSILVSITPKFFLLPLGTILGTLAFVAAAAPLLPYIIMQGAGDGAAEMSFAECMAVGSGFGYYSLSSVLITQIKEPSLGVSIAAQLGTVALMANIMREVITLLLSPLIYRIFGKLAPISSGGATSMDSTLPVITTVCGKEMAFVSIFHGVLVDFSVPFLVTFFASL